MNSFSIQQESPQTLMKNIDSLLWFQKQEDLAINNPNLAQITRIKHKRIFKASIGFLPFEKLSKIFKNLTCVIKLTLKFFEYENEKIKLLCQSFKNMASLRVLTIQLPYNEVLSHREISTLFLKLKSLKHIQEVSFIFSYNRSFGWRELRSIFTGLKQLKSLKSLELGFNVCFGLKKEFFQTLSTGLKSLPSLISLAVDFSSTKINDQELESFCIGLKAQTSLQTLGLGFSHCMEITDQGIKHLALSIKSLVFLEHLFLNITNSDKIGNPGLAFLSGTLKRPLSTFKLDCSHCQMITSQGIENLIRNMDSLKSLKLDFSGCSDIDGEGLRYLREKIEKIKELSILSLSFSNCHKITTSAVISFIYTFGQKFSLKTLKLHLFYCQNVNQSEIQTLLQNTNSKPIIIFNGHNVDFLIVRNK